MERFSLTSTAVSVLLASGSWQEHFQSASGLFQVETFCQTGKMVNILYGPNNC